MADEPQKRSKFEIPQSRAGKEFNRILQSKNIQGFGVTTSDGKPLLHMPVQVHLGELLPPVFRGPLKAVVSVTSILTRIAGLRIVIDVEESPDE